MYIISTVASDAASYSYFRTTAVLAADALVEGAPHSIPIHSDRDRQPVVGVACADWTYFRRRPVRSLVEQSIVMTL